MLKYLSEYSLGRKQVPPQGIRELIINQTEFSDEFYPNLLEWDADLGFMRQVGSQSDASIVVVGFCNGQPSPPEKSLLPDRIVPRTTYESLTEGERTIDKQGKGIGPRLYNTPLGITGLAEYSGMVGMYAVELARERILDTRKPSDFRLTGKATRIARHAGLILKSKIMSVRSTLEDVNDSIDDAAQAVLFNQPPRAAMCQERSRTGMQIVSEFMIIRDATLRLQKHGEVNLRKLTSKD